MEPRTLAPSEPAARARCRSRRGLAVPLHDQHDGPDRNACGTTSAAMVVDYYDGSAQQCHHSDLDALMRPFDLYSAPGRLADAVASTSSVVEGVETARALRAMARQHSVPTPIIDAVCRVLFEGIAPADAVRELMGRSAGTERIA